MLITLRLSNPPAPLGGVILEYQIVDPGKYIALHDPAFERQWTSLPMIAQSNNGSGEGKDAIYSVQLAGSIQKHRRLVRYRIRGGKDGKVLAPDPGDAQPNFAYFVYDGVPDWKGAIDPDALEAKLRQVVCFRGTVIGSALCGQQFRRCTANPLKTPAGSAGCRESTSRVSLVARPGSKHGQHAVLFLNQAACIRSVALSVGGTAVIRPKND